MFPGLLSEAKCSSMLHSSACLHANSVILIGDSVFMFDIPAWPSWDDDFVDYQWFRHYTDV